MNRRALWLGYAALIVAIGSLSYATGKREGRSDPVASVENSEAPGARALFLYLEQRGHEVETLRSELTSLPEGLKTLVIASPERRSISNEEVSSLQRFVAGGGTLVYLAPRPLKDSQRAMQRWLPIDQIRRPAVLDGERSKKDPYGVTMQVHPPHLPFKKLRIHSDAVFAAGGVEALPVAGDEERWSLAYRREGNGEIWWGAGPDLIENRRLELDDNLAFWEHLASRGRLAFDEFHHVRAIPPPVSLGLLWMSIQVVLLVAFYGVARGTRLGPPRPELAVRHRSMKEYLVSFAHLTKRAQVEPALLRESWERFRVTLQNRFGISPGLPDAEAAFRVEQLTGVPKAEFESVAAAMQSGMTSAELPSRDYARRMRALIELERKLLGVEAA